MATFPSGIKSFTTRSNGDTITTALFNEPADEITAIETLLRSSLFSNVNSAGLPVTTSYTPTWGSTGTAPVLGNGTVNGNYVKIGKLVFLTISLSIGSTSTMGTGVWSFTLPGTAAAVTGVFSGFATDSGGARNYMTIGYFSDSTHLSGYAEGGNFIGPTQPFTWATNDSLQLSGWYIET